MSPRKPEAEWLTRKKRIDRRLDALGWTLPKRATPLHGPYRSEEYQTDSGPADYTLHLDGNVVGIIEAKKAYRRPPERPNPGGALRTRADSDTELDLEPLLPLHEAIPELAEMEPSDEWVEDDG